MVALIDNFRLKRAKSELMHKVRGTHRTNVRSTKQMQWIIDQLDLDSISHLLRIVEEDERVDDGKFVTAVEALTTTAFSQFPSLSYRAIHDHYDYALGLTANNITRAIQVITEAFTDPNLTSDQERALIHLEASREKAEAGWNDGSFPVHRRHYSGIIRQAVLDRPKQVEQIINIAATKPDVRDVELTALLDRSTASPLTGGLL